MTNYSIASFETFASESKLQKLRVIFRKGESARFLSHLDLTATLEYAVRRARLNVSLSEGFTRRPRLSVAASLAQGYVGEAEILELTLREPEDPGVVGTRLGAALPAGIEIVSVEEVEPGTRSAGARVQSALYRIELPSPIQDLPQRVDRLLQRPDLEVEEPRDGAIRRRDVRPMILALEVPTSRSLLLEVRLDGVGSVRPEQVLTLMDLTSEAVRVTRERIVLAP